MFAVTYRLSQKKQAVVARQCTVRAGTYVKEFIGQYAQVRLVDERDRRWGHINFDDLKGGIICPHNSDENN